MKTCKYIEYYNLPEEIRNLIKEKYCFSKYQYLEYYPGDGYFKPVGEVRDEYNIMRVDDSDYVYERGDDKIGDYLMCQGAELCEYCIILIDW